MAKKNRKKIEKTQKDWMNKGIFYLLIFLVSEIVISLVVSWIFGDLETSKIQDNYLTAFLQNYNYILGFFCLIPVAVFLYRLITKKLSTRLTDSQIVLCGFLSTLILLVAVVLVCTIVYPINSSTYYGINSKVTAGLFLCPAIVVLLEGIFYAAISIFEWVKNKVFWKMVKRNAPLILMGMFLIWTFISCMNAPYAVDDVLGKEKAMEVVLGSSSKYTVTKMQEEVLSKTLNGCYNLKDGFWAFLMYGSVLLVAMLMGKQSINEKKKLMKIFVFSVLFLAILMLPMAYHAQEIYSEYSQAYQDYIAENNLESGTSELWNRYDFASQSAVSEKYGMRYVYYQRGIFRNSNHFAYVLSMAVIVAALLMMTEKNLLEKILYLFSFIVLTYTLIVNNTFGGYLGVMIAMIAIVIFSIMRVIASLKDNKQRNHALVVLGHVALLVAIFTVLSFTVKDGYGNVIATNELSRFSKDIKNFGGFMIHEENATQTDVATLDESIAKAGSGRGETWLKVWELIKQRPLLGYGLECLLFQFSGQFGVNEGRTHNLLLQLLATVGIPGTIMYFTALAIVFIRLLKNWKTWNDIEKICTFVGISYMVTALTGNSTYYTSPYFMMFLGFVVLTPWKRQDKIEENSH